MGDLRPPVKKRMKIAHDEDESAIAEKESTDVEEESKFSFNNFYV